MDHRLLTIRQASTHVGVSRRTIYNWLRLGKLDFIRTASGSVRIYADSLWRSTTRSTKKGTRHDELQVPLHEEHGNFPPPKQSPDD